MILEGPARPVATLLLAALLAIPLATASHDPDPLPDGAEALACGFPAVSGALPLLPPWAGRCTTTDYQTSIFSGAACPECSARTSYATTNQPLTPAEDVAAQPLPPVPVTPMGPVPTPPVDVPVGTVQAQRESATSQRYCVTFTPAGGAPLGQCVDVGPLAGLLPPVPPTPLVNVGSQNVGPTPGVPAGSLGASPPVHVSATSFDLSVSHAWIESRLNQRVGPGLVNLWEPVDADDATAVQWWANNGQLTPLSLSLTVRTDGAPLQTVAVNVPYAGQAAAAALKTAGV